MVSCLTMWVVLVLLLAAAGAGVQAQPGVKAWIGGQYRQVPIMLHCDVTPGAASQHVVNCKVTNLLKMPLCARLRCVPKPAGACQSTDYGLWWLTGGTPKTGSAKDCSWNVRSDCSSPVAIQPGQAWSFGMMTSYPYAINVSIPAWRLAVYQASLDGSACRRLR